MLDKTGFYYFSPTGGTKKVGEILCGGIAKDVRLTDLGQRDQAVEQPDSDLIVVAAPVFGGRIPAIAAERLRGLDGHGKKAVTLAVYGVRAYEDALLELNDVMEACGFQIAASAALVAQHSIVPEVGQGRLEKDTKDPIKVPGSHPYKDGMSMAVSPISLPACVQCRKCAAICPVGAVQLEKDAVVTDPEKCILCMACTAACPEHARILPPPLQEGMVQKLGALKDVRRENEFFL